MPANPDRDALIEKTLERLRKQMQLHLPDDNATLDQIEEAVDTIGRDVLAELQKQITHKRAKKARDNKIVCAWADKPVTKAGRIRCLRGCWVSSTWARLSVTFTAGTTPTSVGISGVVRNCGEM